jgi:hypothetical protein
MNFDRAGRGDFSGRVVRVCAACCRGLLFRGELYKTAPTAKLAQANRVLFLALVRLGCCLSHNKALLCGDRGRSGSSWPLSLAMSCMFYFGYIMETNYAGRQALVPQSL